MIAHQLISDPELRKKIRRKELVFGGNKKLKIYGTLHCFSGKRMRRENRVFFVSEEEAGAEGYRPCGHCMKREYQHWKHTHGSV
jgi:methylphosphotriester-DNA--protein-cysteine methyltransferase